MSKKKTERKATAKKVPESKGKASTERPEAKKTAKGKELTPMAATVPNKDAPIMPPAPDPRLPTAGTVLQKRDRHGAVRCESTVEEGGVRYADKVYRSLSSAAMAAAKDLGLTNKTQNGFVFWGLSKPPRRSSDPLAALTPVPAAGDRVFLIVTQKATVSSAVQATAISQFIRVGQGFPVDSLLVDASSINVPAVLDTYEHELLSFSGTLSGAFSFSGLDHVQAPLMTTGSPSATNLRLRMLTHLQEQLEPVAGCSVTVRSPLWRFGTTAQPSVWAPQDISLLSCPAPRVVSAAPFSATGLTVRFDRRIDPASVQVNGSQFTLSSGLTVSSATVSGRDVRLTTTSQSPVVSYSVTVDTSVRDSRGSELDPAATTASFSGFTAPAVLRITEVAPNIANQRDLIELQVLQSGSVSNMTLHADSALLATLPDVTVSAGDVIVVHFNPDTLSGGDAPGPELFGKSQYPQASHPNNFDSAWDFHGTAAGLTFANRVLRIRDGYGNIQDGQAFFTPDALLASSASFPSQVRALQAEGHWLPSSCAGVPCTYTSSPSVLSLSASWQGCSTDRSITLQRLSAADTHAASDWAVAPSTLGIPPPLSPAHGGPSSRSRHHLLA